MNIPVDRKLCPSDRPSFPEKIGEATAIAMGASLSAVFFDRPAGRRDRLGAEQDGLPIQRPFVAVELALSSGGVRHVLFVPQGRGTLLSRHLVLRLGGRPVAEIDPNWLQLPQDDLPALTAQLSAQGISRLLRVMLTTGASLFAGQAQAGLTEAIPRLMDICNIPACTPVARTDIAGRSLVSYLVPGLSSLPHPADAVALVEGRLVRLSEADCFAEDDLLHLLLPPGLPLGQVVAFTDAPLRLAPADAAPRHPAPAWIRGRGKPCRDWLFARIGGGTAAALEQELAGGLTEPTIAIRHLSQVPAGLLHLLVLQDPSRVVRKVLLDWQGGQIDLIPSHGADGTAVLAGFANLAGRTGGSDTCRIRVLHHSGRLRTLAEARVAAYDGSIPPGFEEAWTEGADTLRPLAQARAAFRRKAPPFVSQSFGPVQRCGLRIVTSIGTSADVIRARAALILAENPVIPVEVVCTMTEGHLAVAARHALAQTATIYGIPHRLVLLPDFATAGERLCAALSHAGNGPALVLGADVLPQGPGWLSFWLQRLRRRAVLAPALLASDGSIAATREGQDPVRGLPTAHLPASGRRADRPLASCLALGPAGIARLLDAAPHPDPTVWIAGAVGGTARTETRFPFHRFGPATVPGAFAAALAETEFTLIGKDRE